MATKQELIEALQNLAMGRRQAAQDVADILMPDPVQEAPEPDPAPVKVTKKVKAS